jgi:elongator complex protein 4
VLGFGDSWRYELPGVSSTGGKLKEPAPVASGEEKMKIAWRYEALGKSNSVSPSLRGGQTTSMSTFCHSFDLSKRLDSSSIKGQLHSTPSSNQMSLSIEATGAPSPFKAFINGLRAKLTSSKPSTVHRVVIPNLLSPSLYASGCCRPQDVLQFLHSLRAILRQYSNQVTAIASLPVTLFPRSSGLTRWIELIFDGVIELAPVPSSSPALSTSGTDRGTSSSKDGQSQGFLKVHSLPVYHEKGGGGSEGNPIHENLTFALSASKGLVIKPFSLPPLGDEDSKERSPASTVKDGMEF